METVKVDVRKLQLLNDRINQCIDALAQVRQSAHAYQPSFGIGQAGAYGPTLAHSMIPSLPMQHPMAMAHAYQSVPYAPAFAPQPSPWGASPWQQSPWAAAPWASPFASPIGGLSHSSHEAAWARAVEPAMAMRFAQSFPYAFSPVPPVLSL